MPLYDTYTHIVHAPYRKLCITPVCALVPIAYASRVMAHAINQAIMYVFVYFGVLRTVGVSLEVSPQ